MGTKRDRASKTQNAKVHADRKLNRKRVRQRKHVQRVERKCNRKCAHAHSQAAQLRQWLDRLRSSKTVEDLEGVTKRLELPNVLYETAVAFTLQVLSRVQRPKYVLVCCSDIHSLLQSQQS